MSGTGGFQTQVYDQPAFAVAGDRASQNPIFTYDVGAGGLVAGASGVVVGRFAWTAPPNDPEGTPAIANSFGAGPVAGFVMRNQQALNPNFLSFAGMTIQPGYQMALVIGGDFWVVNDGTTQALRGQKCYANFANGKASFAATASPTQAATSTASTISAQTASVTASITNGVMNVTNVGSGMLVPGGVLAGSGVASGTTITSQINGTVGGVGAYNISIPEQTVASTTITETYGLLTVGGSLTGTFNAGQVLTGTGVVTGSTITGLGTGTGGAGTYYTQTQAASSTAINATGNVETSFYALSSGLVGELVKISDKFSAYLS